MPLIGKLKTDHEVGTTNRERNHNKVHAIGAFLKITTLPLPKKIATSRVYHVNITFSLNILACPMFKLGHGDWGAYLGLQNGWYNTETNGQILVDPYPSRGG